MDAVLISHYGHLLVTLESPAVLSQDHQWLESQNAERKTNN